jgi:hypothetical protein
MSITINGTANTIAAPAGVTCSGQWAFSTRPIGVGTAWSVISANQSVTGADAGYLTNAGSQVVVTLPLTSAVGDSVQLVAHSAAGWRLAQLMGQTVYVGNTSTTPGSSGYIESTDVGDSVELVCVVANTTWREVDMQGSLTII